MADLTNVAWRAFVLSHNVRTCMCVLVFSAGGGGGGGELKSQGREGKEWRDR